MSLSCFTFSFRPVMLLIAFTGLVIVTASCGGPAERIRERATVEPSPVQGEREISGVYNIEGSSENGNDPYTGVLAIANQGDVYGFRWTTTKGTRVGTGVQLGNATAASFAPTGGGKGCGVVLYKIASDGALTGRIGLWGEGKYATETTTRVEGRGFVGKYSVNGTSPDGKSYQGTLTIVKDGSGYGLTWSIPEPRVAFAIWKGSVAAGSFGGRQCSFALYDITSNGNLDGDWGGQAAVTFGTETAKLK